MGGAFPSKDYSYGVNSGVVTMERVNSSNGWPVYGTQTDDAVMVKITLYNSCSNWSTFFNLVDDGAPPELYSMFLTAPFSATFHHIDPYADS
jgi:hypothetical protein